MVLPLRQEDIFALFAMFERWRASENAVLIRQQIQAECSADPCFMRFHCCLANAFWPVFPALSTS